jgi:RNA polymerase sigma-70 factor (ECF subfamily)
MTGTEGPEVSSGVSDPTPLYLEQDFESLYVREYPSIVAVTSAMVGSVPLGEDITQQAFLVAYRRWRKVRTYDRPGAFVRRVAMNLAVSGLRRRLREVASLDRLFHDTPGASPPAVTDDPFWEALRALPARQRQVAALRYVEDYTVADIATVLGIAEGSVKAHLHAARKSLAAKLNVAWEDQP